MENNFTIFTLDFKQACILYSIKRDLVLNDISYTEMQNMMLEVKGKREWLKKWESNIDSCLADLNSDFDIVSIRNIHFSDLVEKCNYKNDSEHIWKFLILLECVTFEPYYPIDNIKDNKYDYASSCYTIDYKSKSSFLKKIATLIGVSETLIDTMKNDFESSIKVLSKGWNISGFDYKSLIMSVVSPVMIDPCPSPLLLRIIRSIYHVIKNNENTSTKDTNSMGKGISVGGLLLLESTEKDLIELISISPKIAILEMAKIIVLVKNRLIRGELFKNVALKLFKNEVCLRTYLNTIETNDHNIIENVREGVQYIEKGIEIIKKM